jgi:hypothetical protein
MWIESHQSLRKHPKTLRAARALGVSEVLLIGHIHCLWWWAMDYAPDGDLSSYDAIDIAAAAEWDGDAELFVRALRDASRIGDRPGFIEEIDGALHLHDWDDYAGKLIAKREQDAARKRSARKESGDDADVQRTSGGRPTDGARNSNKQNSNQTEQTPTEQDQPAPTPPAEARANGKAAGNGHGGGDGARSGSALSAEQFVAHQLVQKVAPDFRDLEAFVRGNDARLVAYWALSAGQDVERLDNPAGLIRSMTQKGEWPNVPGYLIEQWKTAVKSNQWRNQNGRHT